MSNPKTEWQESNEEIFRIRRIEVLNLIYQLDKKVQRMTQPSDREASLISLSNICGHLEESIHIADAIIHRTQRPHPD